MESNFVFFCRFLLFTSLFVADTTSRMIQQDTLRSQQLSDTLATLPKQNNTTRSGIPGISAKTFTDSKQAASNDKQSALGRAKEEKDQPILPRADATDSSSNNNNHFGGTTHTLQGSDKNEDMALSYTFNPDEVNKNQGHFSPNAMLSVYLGKGLNTYPSHQRADAFAGFVPQNALGAGQASEGHTISPNFMASQMGMIESLDKVQQSYYNHQEEQLQPTQQIPDVQPQQEPPLLNLGQSDAQWARNFYNFPFTQAQSATPRVSQPGGMISLDNDPNPFAIWSKMFREMQTEHSGQFENGRQTVDIYLTPNSPSQHFFYSQNTEPGNQRILKNQQDAEGGLHQSVNRGDGSDIEKQHVSSQTTQFQTYNPSSNNYTDGQYAFVAPGDFSASQTGVSTGRERGTFDPVAVNFQQALLALLIGREDSNRFQTPFDPDNVNTREDRVAGIMLNPKTTSNVDFDPDVVNAEQMHYVPSYLHFEKDADTALDSKEAGISVEANLTVTQGDALAPAHPNASLSGTTPLEQHDKRSKDGKTTDRVQQTRINGIPITVQTPVTEDSTSSLVDFSKLSYLGQTFGQILNMTGRIPPGIQSASRLQTPGVQAGQPSQGNTGGLGPIVGSGPITGSQSGNFGPVFPAAGSGYKGLTGGQAIALPFQQAQSAANSQNSGSAETAKQWPSAGSPFQTGSGLSSQQAQDRFQSPFQVASGSRFLFQISGSGSNSQQPQGQLSSPFQQAQSGSGSLFQQSGSRLPFQTAQNGPEPAFLIGNTVNQGKPGSQFMINSGTGSKDSYSYGMYQFGPQRPTLLE